MLFFFFAEWLTNVCSPFFGKGKKQALDCLRESFGQDVQECLFLYNHPTMSYYQSDGKIDSNSFNLYFPDYC